MTVFMPVFPSTSLQPILDGRGLGHHCAVLPNIERQADISVPGDDEELASRKPQRTQTHLDIQLLDIEEASWTLSNGVKTTPGYTVELKDRQHPSTLYSGDFLRVRHIIQNVETDEVSFRGFRLWRTKCPGPIRTGYEILRQGRGTSLR